MKYHEMRSALLRSGYQFLRRAKGTHEIWVNRQGQTILVTRSGLNDRHARQNWLSQLRRSLE